MKKNLFIGVLLACLLASAAGCSTSTTTAGESATPSASPSYKDTMVPFSKLVSNSRIVILQNTLNFTREGFYKQATKPQTQDITYNKKTVAAYPVSYALAFLHKGSAGDVVVYKTDSSKKTMTAKEFAGMFVIIDFTSDKAPVLYNPQSKLEIKNFLYAVTAEGEAIYSIVSGSTHNFPDMLKNVGWSKDVSYRFVASDQFYVPVAPNEYATGEVRGTLSGAVNGAFPELKIASGKINDVIYIEVIAP